MYKNPSFNVNISVFNWTQVSASLKNPMAQNYVSICDIDFLTFAIAKLKTSKFRIITGPNQNFLVNFPNH